MMFPFYQLAASFASPAHDALLLHNADGSVGHLQNDAGLGNLTVPHWGLPAARELLLNEVRHYSSSPAVATVAPGSSEYLSHSVSNSESGGVSVDDCAKTEIPVPGPGTASNDETKY